MGDWTFTSSTRHPFEDPRIYTMEAGYDSGHDLGGGDPEVRSGFRTSEGGSRASAVALAPKIVENRRKIEYFQACAPSFGGLGPLIPGQIPDTSARNSGHGIGDF